MTDTCAAYQGASGVRAQAPLYHPALCTAHIPRWVTLCSLGTRLAEMPAMGARTAAAPDMDKVMAPHRAISEINAGRAGNLLKHGIMLYLWCHGSSEQVA
jgi:hypothetical protein